MSRSHDTICVEGHWRTRATAWWKGEATMGLFGKMFEKKTCSICGGEIGLLGNRKLEDCNLCKECARKLSPFCLRYARTMGAPL